MVYNNVQLYTIVLCSVQIEPATLDSAISYANNKIAYPGLVLCAPLINMLLCQMLLCYIYCVAMYCVSTLYYRLSVITLREDCVFACRY